jgi:hypothetical protein
MFEFLMLIGFLGAGLCHVLPEVGIRSDGSLRKTLRSPRPQRNAGGSASTRAVQRKPLLDAEAPKHKKEKLQSVALGVHPKQVNFSAG